MTVHNYGSNRVFNWTVSKGCAPRSACMDLAKLNNESTCSTNEVQRYVQCCTGSYCNRDVVMVECSTWSSIRIKVAIYRQLISTSHVTCLKKIRNHKRRFKKIWLGSLGLLLVASLWRKTARPKLHKCIGVKMAEPSSYGDIFGLP